MSIFGRLLAGRPLRGDVTWSPLDDAWYTSHPGIVTAAGTGVTPERAQQLTTISACVKVISETVATVPIIVYREVAAGKERAPGDPRWRLLRHQPNRWQTSMAFREMLTGHAALRGIGYAEMVGDNFADLELIPRHPDLVRVMETDAAGFATVYGVRSPRTGKELPTPRERMFVLPGPWGGRSPIVAHREAIGLGLARQEYAARFFGNGSRPGGLLKAPVGTTLTDAQRQQISTQWREAHQGASLSHKVAVLEGGLEWQQVGVSAEDSQLLQSMQFGVADMCRIWNVPPHKVQEYGRATWSNTEQMAIDFTTTCMLPWFRRWEEAIRWYLIGDDEPLFAEFLLEGLLRGDTAARFAAYQLASGGRPWMSGNEIRERENLNRVPGLDEIPREAQGAATPDRARQDQPRQRPRDEDEDEDEDDGEDDQEASRLWRSWAAAVAEALLSAELRALDRVASLQARDAQGYADWCRGFYLTDHRRYIELRLAEMRAVWRATTPLPAAVAQLAADGAAWALTSPRDPAARLTSILAAVAERGTCDDDTLAA